MNISYGLIGHRLGHSMSPLIHQFIFEILGKSDNYHLLEVEKPDLREAVKRLGASGAIGVNVTVPYKTEVMRYLDAISPEAAAIGAVNTIAFKGQIVEGYNTDYYGFGVLLERYGINTEGKEALVLGYGGGAKAVIRFLLDNGIESIIVAVRNVHDLMLIDTQDESDRINFVDYESLPLQKNGDIIINCTPVGMYPNVSDTPVSSNILMKYSHAVDLIYNPLETMFLQQADKAGLKAVNGLYMLVGQAAAAQKIWNNVHLSMQEIDAIHDRVEEYMLKSL